MPQENGPECRRKTPSLALAVESAPSGPPPCPIVGIGASAGGLGAFEAFFSGMPAEIDPGMAFVLVQHLAPDHKSLLTELIQRQTRMAVREVEDGMVALPNCVYIIPPGRDMAFMNGALHLLEPSAPRGLRLPIDFFFRSLAQDQHERAIGIVLSGTGSDGSLGVRAIKGEGGMVMAQNPESSEYDGMPRSAAATGLVDYELPPAEMPAQLMAYVAHSFGRPPRSAAVPSPGTSQALKRILILLRAETGHDFSQYKPSTIHRRIERRMAVHQIDSIEDYAKYLEQTSGEPQALFQDLLIGVTRFFRDPEAFKAFEEEIIPKLLTGKAEGEGGVRIWLPGCSTGEEAYSMAILVLEGMEARNLSPRVQIFATDIDVRAVAVARTGLYPASIAMDIDPGRLARFFTAEPGGGQLRINKPVRDLLVFSEQDVIRDPPFSRLDLICCRNLLIYLDGETQKRLIALFHYALNPEGMLFLGTSETVGGQGDPFTVLDPKAKLYQRKDDPLDAGRVSVGRAHPGRMGPKTHQACPGGRSGLPMKRPLREMTEQALLSEAFLAGALIDAQGNILYLHGHTGRFLELPPGEAGDSNILRMAREGLRQELASGLRRVVTAPTERVYRPGLRVQAEGGFAMVNLSLVAVPQELTPNGPAPLFMAIFEDVPFLEPDAPEAAGQGDLPDSVAQIAGLHRKLQAKEAHLQAANEALETSNDGLKTANEEMQSVNEELQSANEELETSKEELQSVNEELATVNSELQTKVTDLSRANNDMNNLLAGTGIGTVFVDHRLRILRFTPTATRIINLIQSDLGRPIGHLVTNLVGYDRLVADIQVVLDTLVPVELEVKSLAGQCFTLRIQPYRTLDNMIEGAVITFVDITELERIRESLRLANALLHRSLADAKPGAPKESGHGPG